MASVAIFLVLCIEGLRTVMASTAVFVVIYVRHCHLDVPSHDEYVGMASNAGPPPDIMNFSLKGDLPRPSAFENFFSSRRHTMCIKAEPNSYRKENCYEQKS